MTIPLRQAKSAGTKPRCKELRHTFAEIGGGQEVSRWFFSVGGAAGTVAETVSAYDKAVSDRVYGPATRYVSRERLEAMRVQTQK